MSLDSFFEQPISAFEAGRGAFLWTPQRVRELRVLWDEGLTGQEIGTRFGITRMAVIAKANRLGLSARPKFSNSKWTPENSEVAARLWLEGVPASKIGSQLGIGKGSVISKMKRMNVVRPDSIKPIFVRSTSRRAYVHRDTRVVTNINEPSAEFRCEMLELTNEKCKFPYGDGPFLFCGHPTAKRPYCEYHTAICFNGFTLKVAA